MHACINSINTVIANGDDAQISSEAGARSTVDLLGYTHVFCAPMDKEKERVKKMEGVTFFRTKIATTVNTLGMESSTDAGAKR